MRNCRSVFFGSIYSINRIDRVESKTLFKTCQSQVAVERSREEPKSKLSQASQSPDCMSSEPMLEPAEQWQSTDPELSQP